MPQPQRPDNQLLLMLPQRDYASLAPELERVSTVNGGVLYASGQPIEHVYFPVSNVLSALILMEDGTPTETAMIGREGMFGVWLLAKEAVSPIRVVQRVEGEMLRIPAVVFQDSLTRSTPLRGILLRYALTLLEQAAQTAACNLHHALEPRLCRWLVEAADRCGRSEILITQENLSETLGVRRQSISLTGAVLQREGLIAFRRGRLKILNRRRLEQSACECYRIAKNAYRRLMPKLAV